MEGGVDHRIFWKCLLPEEATVGQAICNGRRENNHYCHHIIAVFLEMLNDDIWVSDQLSGVFMKESTEWQETVRRIFSV